MADASWDNGGHGIPAKAGMPMWAKVLMGCGIVAVLALATCVGGIAFGFNKVKQAFDGSEWNQLVSVVEKLGTDEGARSVYAANPRLSGMYPTESLFLQAAAVWRPRLEPLPPKMPSLMTGRLDFNVRIDGSHRNAQMGYRNDKGAWVYAQWENGQLTSLKVE